MTLTYGEFQERTETLVQERHAAIEAYVVQAEVAAKAEGEYRKQLAKAFVQLKATKSATEAAECVRGEDAVVVAQIDRDLQQSILKAKLEDIHSIDGERASLHRLGEWSSGINS